jgi:hypothetical protein
MNQALYAHMNNKRKMKKKNWDYRHETPYPVYFYFLFVPKHIEQIKDSRNKPSHIYAADPPPRNQILHWLKDSLFSK